jgi:hypothetical protein
MFGIRKIRLFLREVEKHSPVQEIKIKQSLSKMADEESFCDFCYYFLEMNKLAQFLLIIIY